jgi:hypothetical protein
LRVRCASLGTHVSPHAFVLRVAELHMLYYVQPYLPASHDLPLTVPQRLHRVDTPLALPCRDIQ